MPHWRYSTAALAVFLGCTPLLSAAEPPITLPPGSWHNLVRLSDGTMKRVRANGGYLKSQVSADSGLTWSAEVLEFAMSGSLNPVPMLDSAGDMHYVRPIPRDESNGGTRVLGVNYFLDVWHYTSTDGGAHWNTNLAMPAAASAVLDATQLRSGRLIVPFGEPFVPASSGSGYGTNYTKFIYSDDLGQTWQSSPAQLKSPAPTGWNGGLYGACEPTITQLHSGQLWTLMRTQTDYLYESRSDDDGTSWSAAKPSNFYSSTGNAHVLNMNDGRLVMMWNNATVSPRYDGLIVYSGRDALHAAISDDDGKTWQGFREIYLDPYRHENPEAGDTGTAYNAPAVTTDDLILSLTGQARARTMLRFDPDWLLETSRSSNFANGFTDWSVFKPYGGVSGAKRNRKIGPELVFDAVEQKNVMHIRRPDSDDPDGATWNFPMARKGEMTLRVKLAPGFTGGSIALGDRFFEPTDVQGEANSIFQVPIAANGSLPGGAVLQTARWYTLGLNWDLAAHKATLKLDGQTLSQLDQRQQAKPGPSYLRLRSTASAIDTSGFYISSVSQTGLTTGPVRESFNLNSTDAEAALGAGSGWTRIRFDDYVPNHNTTTNGNGTTGVFGGTFTGFVSPTTAAPPVGILVESSTGSVVFSDNTSTQVTSDIVGSTYGGTLAFTFVDPSHPPSKAAVSSFAFRYGSTVGGQVDVKVYDAENNELPDYNVKTLGEIDSGGAAGMLSVQDLSAAPVIHKIVFTSSGGDTWLLGSFGLDPSLADFAFANFTIVPVAGAWNVNADGNWSAAGNWSGGVPNAAGAVANFGTILTSGRTVTVDSPQTVGQINFSSPVAYTIAGASTLTLDGGSGSTSINVTAGSHTISAPVVLAKDTTVAVAAGQMLSLQHVRGAGLNVASGTVKMIANAAPNSVNGTSKVSGLSVASGASLDLTNNSLIVDYTSVGSLVNDTRLMLQSGKLTTSSTGGKIGYADNALTGLATFSGQVVDSSSILIKFTYGGDANLDGQVDISDLGALATAWQTSGVWTGGDFDYSGFVDISDLGILATNWQLGVGAPLGPSFDETLASVGLGSVSVPEPAPISVLLALAVPVAARRRVD